MDLSKTAKDFPTAWENLNRDINRTLQERVCLEAIEAATSPLCYKQLAEITGIHYSNLANVLTRPVSYGRAKVEYRNVNRDAYYSPRYRGIQPIAVITSPWSERNP
jgi:hypothetical protein